MGGWVEGGARMERDALCVVSPTPPAPCSALYTPAHPHTHHHTLRCLYCPSPCRA